MKKHLLTLAMLLCFGTALAQEQTENNDTIRQEGVDSLYIQLFAGINKSANENMPWTEFTRHPFSGGAFVGIGREFSQLWGWRTVLGIDGNKSRNVPMCESAVTWGWTDLEAWADATFDITDAVRRSKKNNRTRRFNMKAFAGLGGLYTFAFPQDVALSYTAPYSRNSTLNFGLRAGLTATYNVGKQWKIGAELSHLFATDQFNGVNDGKGMDMRTNLKIGVIYTFGPKKNKKADTPVGPIIIANRLKNAPFIPLLAFDPEDIKDRQLDGRSFLDFPVNETKIYPDYRRNPQELQRIYESVEKARFDKSIDITSITLHGYASPESPYSNNTRLAKGRVEALAKQLQKHFALPASIFSLENTPEDWDNLRSYIAENDSCMENSVSARRTVKKSFWYNNDNVIETPVMPAMVRDHSKELLNIIDSSLQPDAKEEALKKVGGGKPYKWLLQNVYPGLRHTDYTIKYVVKKEYPAVEGRRLIYTHPEAMSLEEIYRVVNSYRRGTADWYEAIIIAANLHPENQKANYNAAVACIETHRLKDARNYLENDATPEADYLRDVISAMEGSIKWELIDGKVKRL